MRPNDDGDRHETSSRGKQAAKAAAAKGAKAGAADRPERHEHHGEMAFGHPEEAAHEGHGRHEGHTPAMFRNRFFVTLVLTLPILYYSPLIQDVFGYGAITFPGHEWLTPILATVVFFYGGLIFLRGAARELVAREPGMMTLISLAITVAYLYSLAVTAGLPGEPFYWELTTLILVMLLGHWMEMWSIQSASRALEHLASLLPSVAHRLIEGRVEDVPVADLADGDEILIRPGEQVPADGTIVEGASSLNEAFLTGESRPAAKGEGDEVIAGAVNGEGALRVQVSRTGERTTLSQIMRLVSEAQASRSRYQALGDRAAFWLVGIALTAGALTFGGWAAVGAGATFSIARAVTVLVIACPHALGLAIPLVTVNATSISAKNGILVRNREAFERAGDVRVVALDKTGTLTEGKFGVRAVHTMGVNENDALATAAALEALSEHPLAQAVVEEADRRELPLKEAREFRAVAGKGVEARVEGAAFRVGRPEWAEELQAHMPPALRERLDEAEARGESVVILMDEARVLAIVAMADRIRASARDAITRLHESGIQTVMITGDAEAVAKTVAQELGIDRYYARVLPQDKSKLVGSLRKEARTAFVGDGINDAPALLASDLGIAIGAGTNVAIESADLVLVENDPTDVVRAIRLAKATRAKMKQNLFWATGYNAVAIPLAAGAAVAWGILLSPAVGALFMSGSTVVVALNAMLLRRTPLS